MMIIYHFVQIFLNVNHHENKLAFLVLLIQLVFFQNFMHLIHPAHYIVFVGTREFEENRGNMMVNDEEKNKREDLALRIAVESGKRT